jgi:hypothetical protein
VISICGFIQEDPSCRADGVRYFLLLYACGCFSGINECSLKVILFSMSQDCKEFHQAKDGDGWVEQSFQPVLFGMLHKVMPDY